MRLHPQASVDVPVALHAHLGVFCFLGVFTVADREFKTVEKQLAILEFWN